MTSVKMIISDKKFGVFQEHNISSTLRENVFLVMSLLYLDTVSPDANEGLGLENVFSPSNSEILHF